MAVIVRNCCCGCDLRTGVLIIALFYLAAMPYGIYVSITTVNNLKSSRADIQSSNKIPPSVKQHWDGIIDFSYADVAINVIDLLVSVLLLIGAINKSREMCLVWFRFRILRMLISLAYLIFLVVIWTAFLSSAWIYILDFVLAFYFLVVVYSYAELLKLEEEQGGGQPMHGTVQGHVMTVAYPASTGYGQPPSFEKH